MVNILLYIHQLPQNLIGFTLVHLLKCTKNVMYGIEYYNANKLFFSGISLGNYIILDKRSILPYDIKHEYGHQKQSLYLGWLYLFIIGLLSLTGNFIDRVHHLDYYNLPWEKWADELGGVQR